MSSDGPGQPWPVARVYHSAVSLHDPDGGVSDPALMMWGGIDEGQEVLNDSWSFHVNIHQWREVSDQFCPSTSHGSGYPLISECQYSTK